MKHEIEKQIEFLMEIDKSKGILRMNWMLDQSRREDDAQHAWHACLTAMVLRKYAARPVDIGHVIQMLLVHDIVEIDAGDTYAYDEKGYESKPQREQAAADRIYGMLPGGQGQVLRALWEEFEAGETDDAKFANAVDRTQPFWGNFYIQGRVWKENGIEAKQVIRRNEVTKEIMPEVWEAVYEQIQQAVQNGWLK
ncbi:MAG: HD domain-containing protein [Christensenellales bacterium]|mgnify:FL=1